MKRGAVSLSPVVSQPTPHPGSCRGINLPREQGPCSRLKPYREQCWAQQVLMGNEEWAQGGVGSGLEGGSMPALLEYPGH